MRRLCPAATRSPSTGYPKTRDIRGAAGRRVFERALRAPFPVGLVSSGMKGRLKRRVTRVDVITVTSEIIFLCVLSFLSFCYMAPPRCALSITMNVHAVTRPQTPPARLCTRTGLR